MTPARAASLLSLALAVASPAAAGTGKVAADTVGDDFVTASLLVASPGRYFYQALGHVALRMECPSHGLDNVFSYETDLAGGIAGQLAGVAAGRFTAITAGEYISQFGAEGRGITAYPLNLSLAEKRKLWMMLDRAVESGSPAHFNFRRRNCMSMVLEQVEQAVAPDTLVNADMRYTGLTNGAFLEATIGSTHPWATMLGRLGYGADADSVDPWRQRTVPIIVDHVFSQVTIATPEGLHRPLLTGDFAVIVEPEGGRPSPFTPALVATVILVLSVAVSALDLAGRMRPVIRVLDFAAFFAVTIAALLLIAVSEMPNSTGPFWHWTMLIVNPLPFVAWIATIRSPRSRRIFFIIYGVVAAAYIPAPLLTAEASLWSSLLAAAIAIRTLTHYRK